MIRMAKVDEAIRLAQLGIRNAEIARVLGVSAPTVSRWADRYPEFAQACVKRQQVGAGQGAGARCCR